MGNSLSVDTVDLCTCMHMCVCMCAVHSQCHGCSVGTADSAKQDIRAEDHVPSSGEPACLSLPKPTFLAGTCNMHE